MNPYKCHTFDTSDDKKINAWFEQNQNIKIVSVTESATSAFSPQGSYYVHHYRTIIYTE
jgi:hypothetical protein